MMENLVIQSQKQEWVETEIGRTRSIFILMCMILKTGELVEVPEHIKRCNELYEIEKWGRRK